MAHEQHKLMDRRFVSRLLESILLILAIALGIGASSAGFSLVFETIAMGNRLLENPLYREVQVSTRESLDAMDDPVQLKTPGDGIRLSTEDLEVGTMVDGIKASFIKTSFDLNFINKDLLDRMTNGNFTARAPTNAPPPTDGPPGAMEQAPTGPGFGNTDLMATIDEAMADPSIILAPMESLSGFRVTEGFFVARSVETAFGSLFTREDYSQANSNIVLGHDAALLLIAESALSLGELPGKRILSRQGYQTIVGVLAPSGDSSIDSAGFAPYRTGIGQVGFGGNRQLNGSTVLSFALEDPKQLEDAAQALSQYFETTYGEGKVLVSTPRAVLTQTLKRNTGIASLILFLALAGLFIAGVNVSNILMGRGLRMRKNVGILMALGASKATILRLFAREALGISMFGALAGVLVALPLSSNMQGSLNIQGASPLSLIAGIMVALVLTMAFTLIPAWQNSRIDPAQAMRYM